MKSAILTLEKPFEKILQSGIFVQGGRLVLNVPFVFESSNLKIK